MEWLPRSASFCRKSIKNFWGNIISSGKNLFFGVKTFFRFKYVMLGFLANFRDDCYEKAYIFFRMVGKAIMKSVKLPGVEKDGGL